jgi:hypothetical protein
MQDLVAKIDALQVELNELIDDEARATLEAGVPLEVNRQMIMARGRCACDVVKRLIEAKAKLAADA